MLIDPHSPQATVARQFMNHKGLDVEPFEIERVEGQPLWYAYYKMPEGVLELEIWYEAKTDEWDTQVTSFSPDKALAG